MRRARLLFMVAAFTMVILSAYALPVLAASPANTTVYYPYGNGITYSCNGGPPFVHGSDFSPGNCSLQQIGTPPPGLACNVPTDITFRQDPVHPEDYSAWLCHNGSAGA
jgi:hypothetical protein